MLEAPTGTCLAFDFGAARIGVAQGDAEVAISHPITTITATENTHKFAAIAALIQEWRPQQLVVGLPAYMDGVEHDTSALCRKFAQRLNGRFALPVYLVDERLTSVYAESLLNEAQVYGKKQKAVLDQIAAQAILMTFFDNGALECLQRHLA